MKLKYLISFLLVLMIGLHSSPVSAQGFSAGIAPSRFELKADPGDVLRDTLLIMNAGDKDAGYSLRTADWRITETQGLDYFEDELIADSCRPWVKLERSKLVIRPSGQKRYRFEIHVPEDAPAGLCKFALLVEPADTAMASTGGEQAIKFPVVGRYAVIVYVTIGDANANVDYLGLGRGVMGGLTLPTLRLHNKGTTYDRVFGRVVATDAAGERHILIASTFPVLPGRTEDILLVPESSENSINNDAELVYPLQLKGSFEIAGERFAIENSFEGDPTT